MTPKAFSGGEDKVNDRILNLVRNIADYEQIDVYSSKLLVFGKVLIEQFKMTEDKMDLRGFLAATANIDENVDEEELKEQLDDNIVRFINLREDIQDLKVKVADLEAIKVNRLNTNERRYLDTLSGLINAENTSLQINYTAEELRDELERLIPKDTGLGFSIGAVYGGAPGQGFELVRLGDVAIYLEADSQIINLISSFVNAPISLENFSDNPPLAQAFQAVFIVDQAFQALNLYQLHKLEATEEGYTVVLDQGYLTALIGFDKVFAGQGDEMRHLLKFGPMELIKDGSKVFKDKVLAPILPFLKSDEDDELYSVRIMNEARFKAVYQSGQLERQLFAEGRLNTDLTRFATIYVRPVHETGPRAGEIEIDGKTYPAIEIDGKRYPAARIYKDDNYWVRAIISDGDAIAADEMILGYRIDVSEQDIDDRIIEKFESRKFMRDPDFHPVDNSGIDEFIAEESLKHPTIDEFMEPGQMHVVRPTMTIEKLREISDLTQGSIEGRIAQGYLVDPRFDTVIDRNFWIQPGSLRRVDGAQYKNGSFFLNRVQRGVWVYTKMVLDHYKKSDGTPDLERPIHPIFIFSEAAAKQGYELNVPFAGQLYDTYTFVLDEETGRLEIERKDGRAVIGSIRRGQSVPRTQELGEKVTIYPLSHLELDKEKPTIDPFVHQYGIELDPQYRAVKEVVVDDNGDEQIVKITLVIQREQNKDKRPQVQVLLENDAFFLYDLTELQRYISRSLEVGELVMRNVYVNGRIVGQQNDLTFAIRKVFGRPSPVIVVAGEGINGEEREIGQLIYSASLDDIDKLLEENYAVVLGKDGLPKLVVKDGNMPHMETIIGEVEPVNNTIFDQAARRLADEFNPELLDELIDLGEEIDNISVKRLEELRGLIGADNEALVKARVQTAALRKQLDTYTNSFLRGTAEEDVLRGTKSLVVGILHQFANARLDITQESLEESVERMIPEDLEDEDKEVLEALFIRIINLFNSDELSPERFEGELTTAQRIIEILDGEREESDHVALERVRAIVATIEEAQLDPFDVLVAMLEESGNMEQAIFGIIDQLYTPIVPFAGLGAEEFLNERIEQIQDERKLIDLVLSRKVSLAEIFGFNGEVSLDEDEQQELLDLFDDVRDMFELNEEASTQFEVAASVARDIVEGIDGEAATEGLTDEEIIARATAIISASIDAGENLVFMDELTPEEQEEILDLFEQTSDLLGLSEATIGRLNSVIFTARQIVRTTDGNEPATDAEAIQRAAELVNASGAAGEDFMYTQSVQDILAAATQEIADSIGNQASAEERLRTNGKNGRFEHLFFSIQELDRNIEFWRIELNRFNTDVIPYWQEQEILSRQEEDKHDYVVAMLELQIALRDNASRILQLNIDQRELGIGSPAIFETPQEIIGRVLDAERRNVELLTLSNQLIAESTMISAIDFADDPDTEEFDGAPLTPLYLTEFAREFFAQTISGFADSRSYIINEVIPAGRLSQVGIDFMNAWIASLDAEEAYINNTAIPLLDIHEAFQISQEEIREFDMTLEEILELQKNARTEEEAVVAARLLLIYRAQALGADYLRPDLAAQLRDRLELQHEQATAAAKSYFARMKLNTKQSKNEHRK